MALSSSSKKLEVGNVCVVTVNKRYMACHVDEISFVLKIK